jgi:hypothetical protein
MVVIFSADGCYRRDARADRLSIEMHRAGAALRYATAEFGAGHAEVSRSTQSKGVSELTSTCCRLPLTLMAIMLPS